MLTVATGLISISGYPAKLTLFDET